MRTYWIRQHCHWLLVTTSLAVWAATPHAVVDVACSAWRALPEERAVPSVIAPGAPIEVPEPGTLGLLALGIIATAFGLPLTRR